MAAVTICSDFGAQKHKVWHCFHCLPIYLPWGDASIMVLQTGGFSLNKLPLILRSKLCEAETTLNQKGKNSEYLELLSKVFIFFTMKRRTCPMGCLFPYCITAGYNRWTSVLALRLGSLSILHLLVIHVEMVWSTLVCLLVWCEKYFLPLRLSFFFPNTFSRSEEKR